MISFRNDRSTAAVASLCRFALCVSVSLALSLFLSLCIAYLRNGIVFSSSCESFSWAGASWETDGLRFTSLAGAAAIIGSTRNAFLFFLSFLSFLLSCLPSSEGLSFSLSLLHQATPVAIMVVVVDTLG